MGVSVYLLGQLRRQAAIILGTFTEVSAGGHFVLFLIPSSIFPLSLLRGLVRMDLFSCLLSVRTGLSLGDFAEFV